MTSTCLDIQHHLATPTAQTLPVPIAHTLSLFEAPYFDWGLLWQFHVYHSKELPIGDDTSQKSHVTTLQQLDHSSSITTITTSVASLPTPG
ncbi:hypothetical protein VTJ04DRAFT_6144 [Mycothermus thermophilus]|uniref:uncharacterized protein n=1 Tax=Humicola insolens TaxID=85995 RepID=UPI0037430946